MNILIITQHLGKTAPGKVFENIIRELVKYFDISVITYNNDINDQRIVKDLTSLMEKKEPIFINTRFTHYLNKISYKLFNIGWTDFVAQKENIVLDSQFDLILALCSMNNTIPLSVSKKLSSRHNIPSAAYFVDAIPSPPWWTNSKLNRGVKNYIKHYTKHLSYLASSNEKMLEYQKEFVHPKCSSLDVILTPSETNVMNIPNKEEDPYKKIFLYTGSLYGLRKVNELINAFKDFLKEYPESEIHFVGRGNEFLKSLDDKMKDHIKIFDFTNDLSSFYQNSDVLIDIDADYDGDIFLSSKICNYLTIKRPIICITGANSPARSLFDGKKSIYLVHHEKEEILESMKSAVNIDISYEDRIELIEKFSAGKVVDHLAKKIVKTIRKNG